MFNWDNFESWRKSRGITARKIAEIAGISEQEYYRKRTNKTDLGSGRLFSVISFYEIDNETVNSFFVPLNVIKKNVSK